MTDHQNTADPQPYKPFRRSRDGWIAGLCAGTGEFLGVDPILVRVTLIVLTVLGFGCGILLYFICWLIVPREEPFS